MIEIKNLSKSFNEHKVLDNLTLTINTGETTVIIGPSGCGKSVLLRLIIGILRPDSGEIIIGGCDITKMEEKALNRLRLKFGMLFQGAALFDSLTVGENVGLGLCRNTNWGELSIARRVKECLEMVGLKDIEDIMPSELSGGMKKRVGLARAICMSPDIILYDEPTTGIDPIMGAAINGLIKELHDKLKVTSIAVTHDMVSAYKIADRIAMLYEGKIIEVCPPEQIKSTNNPVVRQFINGDTRGPITETEHISFRHIKNPKIKMQN